MISPMVFVRIDQEGKVNYIQVHEAGVDYWPKFEGVTEGIYRYSLAQFYHGELVDYFTILVKPRYGIPDVGIVRGERGLLPESATAANDMYKFTFWLSILSPEEYDELLLDEGDT